MKLIANRYGKGRVRVLRVDRAQPRHVLRELSVLMYLQGDFAPSYTAGDNSTVIATDTIKNVAYIVAGEMAGAGNEAYCTACAQRFLDKYPQVQSVRVIAHETRWRRAVFDGAEHDHAFLLDGNGKPRIEVEATREGTRLTSGISGYTFLKSTGSGWMNYVMDDYTTLLPTTDRIASTAMDATWTWNASPASYDAANDMILATMLEVFATTYSHGVQDSLYRMAEAALRAVPEMEQISLACPNKHYIPVDLTRFGGASKGEVFVATDDPHGQIECTVGR